MYRFNSTHAYLSLPQRVEKAGYLASNVRFHANKIKVVVIPPVVGGDGSLGPVVCGFLSQVKSMMLL